MPKWPGSTSTRRGSAIANLLSVFWQTHDPTTLDRQGGDIGDQYRSVIFTHSAEQSHEARQMLQELDRSGAYPAPIVTLVQEASTFFPAEQYHHDYFRPQRKPRILPECDPSEDGEVPEGISRTN